jgi:magnesium-transporting ATPase (P-type)
MGRIKDIIGFLKWNFAWSKITPWQKRLFIYVCIGIAVYPLTGLFEWPAAEDLDKERKIFSILTIAMLMWGDVIVDIFRDKWKKYKKEQQAFLDKLGSD